MTTMTITHADWEALEGIVPTDVAVDSVTGTLIVAHATFGASQVAEFRISGTWTGVSGTSLDGLVGTVSGISLSIDGVSQFAATGLAVDISEVREDLFVQFHDVIELALGENVEVEGSEDDDSVSGSGGDDSVSGHGGDDDLFGDLGDDSLSGGDGRDSLDGGGGDDSLDGGIGDDFLQGGDGNDRVGSGSGNDVVGGGLGRDRLSGGEGADNLNGGNGSDILSGGTGNDRLTGGAGTDVMAGGAGNDTYQVESVADSILEVDDGGVDTQVCSVSDTLDDNVENLVLAGSAALNGTGNTAANAITGNAGNNALAGGLGDDWLSGNDGADVVSGGSGADDLFGGIGNDVLSGGRDHDDLVGGAGADSFRFLHRAAGDSDRITDFSSADDTIVLENSVFTALGSTATGAIGAGNFVANTSGAAVDADDFIVYETDTGRVFYDADGSGAGAKVEIALVGSATTLTAADFVLV